VEVFGTVNVLFLTVTFGALTASAFFITGAKAARRVAIDVGMYGGTGVEERDSTVTGRAAGALGFIGLVLARPPSREPLDDTLLFIECSVDSIL
jgi:hypothetical protein